VAVVGGYGVGLTFRADRVPERGATLVGRSFRTSHGGKGSNQAIAASRLGAAVSLLTAVGEDAYGRAARQLWVAEGVDAAAVRVATEPTMVGAIIVEPGGENRILIALGALDQLGVDDVDRFEPAIAEADVVLVSLEVPLAVVERACVLARAHGRTVVLNPAPARPLDATILHSVDFLVPNRSEAAAIAGLGVEARPPEILATLAALTPAAVVLTLGADGALVGGRGAEAVHLPAPAVEVVDTTGAGDALNGALAVALAEGADPVAAAAYGVRAGSHSVRVAEALPSLPHRGQVGGPDGET
jgi:ribokinase